jgi:dsRNA-specific ribonuclease
VSEYGIMGAIALLGQLNEEKSDKFTHKLVKQTIKAMENKKRGEWPNKELRAYVNQLDKLQYKYLLDTLKDMAQALDEAYGDLYEE